jgi:hypothetical protein
MISSLGLAITKSKGRAMPEALTFCVRYAGVKEKTSNFGEWLGKSALQRKLYEK